MIQKIKLKTVNNNCLKIYLNFLFKIFKYYNIKFKYVFLPKKIKTLTFLKSPHVFKKAKEHFKLTEYSVFLIFKVKNLNSLKSFMNLYKPTALKIKITLERR